METLSAALGWASLVLGTASILLGLMYYWNHRNDKPPAPPQPSGPVEHGAVVDAVKAATDFAKAIKDLDRAAQLVTFGLLLFAIAGIVAGLDSVATAIQSAASTVAQ
jgi:hypothetical protein